MTLGISSLDHTTHISLCKHSAVHDTRNHSAQPTGTQADKRVTLSLWDLCLYELSQQALVLQHAVTPLHDCY